MVLNVDYGKKENAMTMCDAYLRLNCGQHKYRHKA